MIMEELPVELVKDVFRWLDVENLRKACFVSTTWNTIASSPDLWEALCRRKWISFSEEYKEDWRAIALSGNTKTTSGHWELVIRDFLKVASHYQSPSVHIGDSEWAVISKVQAAADGQKFVGFFLEARGLVSLEVKKRYKADFTVELHSINGAEKETEAGGPIKRSSTGGHQFDSANRDWGWARFLKLADVPLYILDDSIRLSATVEHVSVQRTKQNPPTKYLSVHVVTEDHFSRNHRGDLAAFENIAATEVDRNSTVGELLKRFDPLHNIPPEHQRVWIMITRSNRSVRPSYTISRDETWAEIIARHTLYTPDNKVNVFVQDTRRLLNRVIGEDNLLLFVKHFEPSKQELDYVGCFEYPLDQRCSGFYSMMREAKGYTPGAEIKVYEEISRITAFMVSMEVDGDGTVRDNEFVNGDVVVFQGIAATAEYRYNTIPELLQSWAIE